MGNPTYLPSRHQGDQRYCQSISLCILPWMEAEEEKNQELNYTNVIKAPFGQDGKESQALYKFT